MPSGVGVALGHRGRRTASQRRDHRVAAHRLVMGDVVGQIDRAGKVDHSGRDGQKPPKH